MRRLIIALEKLFSNYRSKTIIRIVVVFFTMISLHFANAQITLDLKNPIIVNGGVDLSLQTQYRFQNVGVGLDGFAIDALVTIQAKSPNVNLLQIDDNIEPFTSGISDFRPIVQNSTLTPLGDDNGDFVDFHFEFVRHIDNSIPVFININTYLYDIDGNEYGLREYVQVTNFNSYTLNNPTALDYMLSGKFEANSGANLGDDDDSDYLAKTTHSLISNFSYRAGVLRDKGVATLPRLFALSFELINFDNPIETTAANDSKLGLSVVKYTKTPIVVSNAVAVSQQVLPVVAYVEPPIDANVDDSKSDLSVIKDQKTPIVANNTIVAPQQTSSVTAYVEPPIDTYVEYSEDVYESCQSELDKVKNIYFGLDKSNITYLAVLELKKVIAVMNRCSEININASSHTDCRASDRYNETLSWRRARATVNYIADVGRISRKRLRAIGFGEKRLMNHCADFIKCTEAEHQKNRRTQFEISNY